MAQNTLEIVAKIKADTAEAQKSIQQLMQQFQNFQLGGNLNKNISAEFAKVEKAYGKLQQITSEISGNKATVAQLEQIKKASKEIDAAMSSLYRSIGQVKDKDLLPGLSSAELEATKKQITSLQSSFTKIFKNLDDPKNKIDIFGSLDTNSWKKIVDSGFDKNLEKLYSGMKDAAQNLDGKGVLDSLKNLKDKIAERRKEIGKEITQIANDLLIQKIDKNGKQQSFIGAEFVNELQNAQTDIAKESQKIKTQAGQLNASLFGAFSDKSYKGLAGSQAKIYLNEITKGLSNFDFSKIDQIKQAITDLKALPETGFGSLSTEQVNNILGTANNQQIENFIQQAEKAKEDISKIKADLTNTYSDTMNNLGLGKDFSKIIKSLDLKELDTTAIDKVTEAVSKLQSKFQENSAEYNALGSFNNALNKAFNPAVRQEIENTSTALETLNQKQKEQQQTANDAGMSGWQNFTNSVHQAVNGQKELTSVTEQTTGAIIRQKEEFGQVISRFAQFGTMTGIVRTFSKVVRSAFQSVKELDEAMNNIAVVTDYTTTDLWNQIDAYTAMAQATGSTIKGSYEVAQLYYQQGLTDAEVMAAANETLKMARISNIDYAAATDYATAAVKGFGLAYQDLAHINDVYSNLAAKTAADTEEISIAMSKVASIAHSTGMELETTAAFLTQIIATTREAPETAGTALKTVIARFAEVKKLISQGEATGTDEEGTEVSVNNIEAALKTAGVALRDTTGQMRDLDDVFIELASRWDSLDTMQQRYIATQAAGSRQQSRFLAMMNDYKGLQETLGYAMDSEGASQEQFNKTLDSLQSKLNNLSNAWTEFTTGILNQDVIKFGVDALTQILNLINNITGSLGPAGSTISKTLLLFGALRYGTGGAGSILNLLGVDNHLPTILDQWKTGALGNIINTLKGTTGAVKGLNTAMAGTSKTATGFWSSLALGGKATIIIAGLALIAAAIYGIAKAIKTTKEKAQEFQDILQDLKDINNETADIENSLSNLYSYKEGIKDEHGNTIDGMDDFSTLQKGVGSYGQNISLTNEQYSRYLEICDAIVALNPDIAEGYSSNAEAIAKEKDALEELITTQEKDLRIKALQIATTMDTNFYEDVKSQAELYQQEKNDLQQGLTEKESQWIAIFNPKGTIRESGYENLLGKTKEEAYDRFDLFRQLSGARDFQTTLQELIDKESEFKRAIQESGASIEDQGTALWVLSTLVNASKSSIKEYNDQIELVDENIEKQEKEIKDQWVAMLPSADGWFELSDKQQSFFERYVQNLEIDLTDPTAMSLQEADIISRVEKVQQILDENKVTFNIDYKGTFHEFTLTTLIDQLGTDKFAELGLKDGTAWVSAVYQGILTAAKDNKNLQVALMSLFGFQGSWEDFSKLGAGGFAEQVYGTSYTDRISNMQKFATERAEAEYGREASPQDFEAEYSDWYNWLRGQTGETADIIMNHYSELVAALNNEGKKVTKETLEEAAKEYLDAVTNVEEMIKKATEAGLDKDDITAVKEYYDNLYKDKDIGGTLTTEVAINAIAEKTGIEAISSGYENWSNLLKDVGNDLDHLTTDQILAFDEMANALRTLFELSDDYEINKDILKSPKIFDLMRRAAEKDADAIEELGDIVSKDLGDSLNQAAKDYNKANKDAENFNEISENIAEGIDKLGESMQIGEYRSVEELDGWTQAAIEGLQTLLDQGMITIDQAQAYASEHGLVLDIKTSDMEMEDVTGKISYQADGSTTIAGKTYDSSMTMTGTSSVPMPKIVGVSKPGGGGGGTKPSGGGGGGGSKPPTKPKQDPFYNYIKTVDDYKKHLESLQDVQELLTKPFDIFNNTKAQEDYYKTLLGSNQSYLNHVNSELERLQKEAQSKYSKYIEVSIDGSLRLTEKYWASTGDITEELDEWIDAYDDVLGRQKDLTDEINDYKKELKDLWEGWRDSFIDLTNDIADVFQELDEKQLEDRQEFYEKLEEQDQRYLESVRNNIEEERKARERANNFEDLQKKQSRLSLLQRDSSGRYANDIAELQEEINSDQQDLADENVDNILDTLEKQMDKDAERHQDILDAMQKQIDSNVENRIYIERAEQTIAQGEKAILDAIHMGEDWRNASNAEREKMDEEQATNIAGAKSYLDKLNEGITSSSEYISKMVTDALTKQTESLIWTIGDIPQNDEAHVAHAMETTLPSILEQFFARTTTAQDMANDNATNKAKKYATGGIVDYTGPAWVDGTPGKPEAFLNANQTAMIAAFTSNLAKMISGKFPSSDMETGNNCEINIEIGSIGADYDIDQAINKVKQEIVNSAQFRNVTLLNRRR